MLNLRRLNDAPESDAGGGEFSAPAFVTPSNVTGNLGGSLADDLLFSHTVDSLDSSNDSYTMSHLNTPDCEAPRMGAPEVSAVSGLQLYGRYANKVLYVHKDGSV